MDLFEVLLVLAFIVLPLLEGVFRQRKGKGGAPTPAPRPQRQRERVESGVPAGAPAGAPEEPETSAAEMIPADLWEVLTGERPPTPRPAPPPAEPASWEAEPSAESLEAEALEEGWVTPPWERPSEWKAESDSGHEPISIEYVGEESLSLETLPPPPEIRHRRFHEKYDTAPALQLSGDAAPSPVIRELRAGLRDSGLRRSILLAEILGPPKGLS